MYVQCTMYFTLCRRWRAYNRIILVQNAPSRTNQTVVTVPESTESTKPSGRRKTAKKSTAAVQSVVTISTTFSGTNQPAKINASSEQSDCSAHFFLDNVVINESPTEEMATLLDLKTQPPSTSHASQESLSTTS